MCACAARLKLCVHFRGSLVASTLRIVVHWLVLCNIMHKGCELKDGSVSNFGQFLVKNIHGNQRKTMQMKNEWDVVTNLLKE